MGREQSKNGLRSSYKKIIANLAPQNKISGMAKRSKNPFSSIMNTIPAPMRNRYFLVLALFFAWMIFFDRHDLLTQWKLSKSVEKLERDKAYYTDKIVETKKNKKEIESNREKFAREKYFMHKANEDVFIIQKK